MSTKIMLGCCLAGGWSFVPGRNCPSDPDKDLEPVERLLKRYRQVIAMGYDFAEGTASALSSLTNTEFEKIAEYADKGEFSLLAVNSFLPGNLGLAVEGTEEARAVHVDTVMSRLARCGGKYAVFGSGGARRLPDGETLPWKALDDFLLLCDRTAEKYGLEFLIEPLNRKETNVYKTLGEAFSDIQRLGLKHTGLVNDCFHYFSEEPSEPQNGYPIRHVHLAEWTNRYYPSAMGGKEVESFIKGLLSIGYQGAFSVECLFNDYIPEMTKAYTFLRGVLDHYES